MTKTPTDPSEPHRDPGSGSSTPPPGRRSRFRAVSLLVGAGLLAGALLLAFRSQAEEPKPNVGDRPVKAVRVATVELTDAIETVRFAGVVTAAREATLSFPVGARLISRSVDVGDPVERGQTLARLDTEELNHRRDSAAAGVRETTERLAQFKRDQARVERLLAAKAATPEELEQLTSTIDAQLSSLQAEQARSDDVLRLLSETRLSAPYAGTVTRTLAEPGEFVQPGQPIVELSGNDAMEIQIGVPESFLSKVQLGAETVVEFPLIGLRNTGLVQSIGRAAMTGSGLFPIKISLPSSERLLPGMTAEVLLADPRQGRLTVPLSAVLNPGGQQPSLLRLEGSTVRRVAIEVSSLIGDRIAVEGALEAGETVVITGHTALIDGDRVEVLP